MNSPYSMIAMFAVLGVAFYFLMIRPQKKRQQEQAKMMAALEPGARVLTSTGIFATIVEMGDRQVVLETSPGARLTVVRQALAKVVTADDEDVFDAAGASTAVAGPVESEELTDSHEPADSLDPIDPDRQPSMDPTDPREQASASSFDPRRPGSEPVSGTDTGAEPTNEVVDDPEPGLNDPSGGENDPEDTSPNTKDQ